MLIWPFHTRTSFATPTDASLLAYGKGRSYGDVCLNDQGYLIDTSRLDHFIHFDKDKGLLRCESGVTLAAILQLVIPHGWFLPVTPGTKFVTLGGAIANDVHGKNHHRTGSFGCHVTQFELLRSDGQRLLCTPTTNSELFKATIGGLGLTGLISWAKIQLKKIHGPYIDQQTLRFANLGEFFLLSEESDMQWEYTVAWIDCMAKGTQLGRGLFMRGNHSKQAGYTGDAVIQPSLNMPFNAPSFALNGLTVSAFNHLYYRHPVKQAETIFYEPFFYPLDKIANWNRMYGKRGFLQYQCVVPNEHAAEAMRQILHTISQSKQGSFLSVLKQFGDIKSPGMMSFPRPGTTLALDFAHQGKKTLALLDALDDITMSFQGAVYPAKDARMSGKAFKHYFPQYEQFQNYIDPAFSSGFWRRVTQEHI